MASCAPPVIDAANDSDYGSDLDSESEQLVIGILTQLEAGAVEPVVLASIIEENAPPRSAAVRPPKQQPSRLLQPRTRWPPSVEINYDNSPGNLAGESSFKEQRASVEPEAEGNGLRDGRSPLERFRTLPMKPLSVTDIISPAWCELQYWYTLTKHGRKRRTPAMQQGSRVHKVLEEQVHTTVEVLVQSREDAWGLKIWNIIQGLRTLRNTGSTRELEVWGIIDGQVVNGIIDELSYTCPDEALEESANVRMNSASAQPTDQPSISDFFKAQGTPGLESERCCLGKQHRLRKVYITDVKTRGSKTLPQGSSMRPTIIQLMLYRRLLSDLASNRIDAETVFNRYRLKSTEIFTDAFIAEVAGLDFNFREDSPDDHEALFSSQGDSVSELLAHNSLTKLWGLMVQEFTKAISGPNAVSQVLRAEFRNQQTGSVMGSKTFLHDEKNLNKYLTDEMRWWRGERKAKGVDIEEAFKCRFCEFAELCDWRREKIEEATEKYRMRSGSRSKSIV